MPQYRRATEIEADPDELFQFLSKVENLPTYFHRMKEAHPATGDEVIVTANVPEAAPKGEDDVQSYAEFRIDADHRSLSWGEPDWASRSASSYHGELSVTPDGSGSVLEVTLHTHREDESIPAGIDETLHNVKTLAVDHRIGA